MAILTTDFHTHILPNVDDGSTSVEESANLVRQEIEQGVHTIFLTPHFNAKKLYPEEFISKRNGAVEELRHPLNITDPIPNFVMGAEVQYCAGMCHWEQLDLLTLGDSGYILIEMPLGPWNDHVFKELETIYTERNIVPILAHIERYITPFNMKKTLQRLSCFPVLLQVNCSYINNRCTRKKAIKLLNSRKIHLIGSDCHRADWRPPDIKQTREILEKHLTPDAMSHLSETECAVLRGDRIVIKPNTFS